MDLTRIGTLCLTGLFVYLIFAIIHNDFNLPVGSLIMPTYFLALFAGITAYDMQNHYNYI